MPSYNILTEPWLKAKYLDGTIKNIGLIEAFKKATEIETLMTPEFQHRTFYLYEMLAMQLMSTITMSAYNHAGLADTIDYIEELHDEDTLWTDEIQNYFERFSERFDLCSEEYPFLQDKSLKGKPSKDTYRSLLNPVVLDLANKAIGGIYVTKKPVRSDEKIDFFEKNEIYLDEAVYLLLYNASLSEVANTYGQSVQKSAQIFAHISGKNLKETVINNCFTLYNSHDVMDVPVWEMDTYDEYFKYKNLQNYVLACLYFPGQKVFLYTDDNKVTGAVIPLEKEMDAKLYIISRGVKDSVKKKYVGGISTEFILHNPWALREHIQKRVKDKETGKEEIIEDDIYRKFDANEESWGLAVAIANTAENFNPPALNICRRLGRKYKFNLYCRQYTNENLTAIDRSVKYSLGNIDWLMTADGKELALEFKKAVSSTTSRLIDAIKCIHTYDSVKTVCNDASHFIYAYAENIFANIWDDSKSLNEMEEQVRKLFKQKALKIYRDLFYTNSSPFNYVLGYKKLNSLKVVKTRKEKKDG